MFTFSAQHEEDKHTLYSAIQAQKAAAMCHTAPSYIATSNPSKIAM